MSLSGLRAMPAEMQFRAIWASAKRWSEENGSSTSDPHSFLRRRSIQQSKASRIVLRTDKEPPANPSGRPLDQGLVSEGTVSELQAVVAKRDHWAPWFLRNSREEVVMAAHVGQHRSSPAGDPWTGASRKRSRTGHARHRTWGRHWDLEVAWYV